MSYNCLRLASCTLLKSSIFALACITLSYSCIAMDLEPRKWSHLPMDANFGGVGYAHTDADIKLNPVLLLEDVEMSLDTWAAKYIRTFEVFNKSARIDFTQGYHEGKWTGLLDGKPASTKRHGLSDGFIRFAVNLYGAPPLRGKEFGAYRASQNNETIVGAALNVRLPTGNYMDDKLINLGKNRFAFRPQVGVVHTQGKWMSELTGELAFFTDNDDFYNGKKLEQAPIYIVHGHLIRTFSPGLWASASVGYDYGGETTINGVNKDDHMQNIGWALSGGYPVSQTIGIKATYIGSKTQESTGFDSKTLIGSLSFHW